MDQDIESWSETCLAWRTVIGYHGEFLSAFLHSICRPDVKAFALPAVSSIGPFVRELTSTMGLMVCSVKLTKYLRLHLPDAG